SDDLIDRDPLLRAGIAIAHGNGLVRDGLAVDRETIRTTRFVHARVTLADRLLLVEFDRADAPELRDETAVQLVRDLAHLRLVDEREHAGFDRRDPRVELHDLRARTRFVFRVCLA